jgi:hypothetical protein
VGAAASLATPIGASADASYPRLTVGGESGFRDEHGTRSLLVPIGLSSTAVSVQYCFAARCPQASVCAPKPRTEKSRSLGARATPHILGSGVNVQPSKSTAYRAFQTAVYAAPVPRSVRKKQETPGSLPAATYGPFPRLAPYQRCTCGACEECRDNAKWDRIFAKFEVKEREVHGMFQCALEDF